MMKAMMKAIIGMQIWGGGALPPQTHHSPSTIMVQQYLQRKLSYILSFFNIKYHVALGGFGPKTPCLRDLLKRFTNVFSINNTYHSLYCHRSSMSSSINNTYQWWVWRGGGAVSLPSQGIQIIHIGIKTLKHAHALSLGTISGCTLLKQHIPQLLHAWGCWIVNLIY